MILLLTAIDELGETREFSCQLPRLESGFDLLTYMDANGQTLVKARIVDEGGWSSLPLKAADGTPTAPVVQELDKNWRQILDESATLPPASDPLDSDRPEVAPALAAEHSLVYFSTSFGLFQEEDLASILQQSRRNNAGANITGLLLYMNGSIIQVLEGEKLAVESLYKRIEQDQRHTHVVCVLSRPISHRLFSRWSMAYETLTTSQLEDIETIVASFRGQPSVSPADDAVILKTLKAFYESNRQ